MTSCKFVTPISDVLQIRVLCQWRPADSCPMSVTSCRFVSHVFDVLQVRDPCQWRSYGSCLQSLMCCSLMWNVERLKFPVDAVSNDRFDSSRHDSVLISTHTIVWKSSPWGQCRLVKPKRLELHWFSCVLRYWSFFSICILSKKFGPNWSICCLQ